MTLYSPRIYTYKITFEEVPYYYYGVHKEKRFDEEYWGSPYTHKWCWELYTPKKQILEIFEYSNNGYTKAQEVEKRLITPLLNNKWCLNENVGGVFSLKSCSYSGRKGAEKIKELGLGIHTLTLEERKENSKKGGNKCKELGLGVCGRTKEKMREDGKKGAEKTKELGLGIHALTLEQRIEINKKINSQRLECTETGYITTSGPLTLYQRKRGIDTSKRIKIS